MATFNVVRKRDAWTLLAAAREKGVDAALVIPTTLDVDADKRAIFVNAMAQEAAQRFPALCQSAEPTSGGAADPDECGLEDDADPLDLCAQYATGIEYGRTVRRFGPIVTIATRCSANDPCADLQVLTWQAQILALQHIDYVIIPRFDEGIPWPEVRAVLDRALEPIANHVIYVEPV